MSIYFSIHSKTLSAEEAGAYIAVPGVTTKMPPATQHRSGGDTGILVAIVSASSTVVGAFITGLIAMLRDHHRYQERHAFGSSRKCRRRAA
jgi:hypothetical protein